MRSPSSARSGRARRSRFGFLRSALRVGIASAIALTARASLADHYRVPSGSMEPTVHVEDHIVVWKAAYGLRVPFTDVYALRYGSPARGDVVVLEPPGSHETPPHAHDRASSSGPTSDDDAGIGPLVLLKRVVAVEGDRVEVRDGHVLIGDHVVTEPAITLAAGGGPDFGPTVVPAGKVLVLGDNRGNSRDGRTFGLVDRATVLGRAFAVVARDGALTYEPL